jgi:multiple sugar transport system ATP-binding protein
MTVDENLGFSLKVRKVPKTQARETVHEVARVLSSEPLLDRKPKALSGGRRQRVAMGRAVVRHPKVFLMDEPLSNLDAKLRVAMRGELTRLHRQYRTTTLYVTHDQIEAMTLGDRIAVLNAGRLQQVGTPDELYRRPVNVFVASFIGSPAMNLATAELVTDTDGALLLRVGEYRWPSPSPPATNPAHPASTSPRSPWSPWAARRTCCSCRPSRYRRWWPIPARRPRPSWPPCGRPTSTRSPTSPPASTPCCG